MFGQFVGLFAELGSEAFDFYLRCCDVVKGSVVGHDNARVEVGDIFPMKDPAIACIMLEDVDVS